MTSGNQRIQVAPGTAKLKPNEVDRATGLGPDVSSRLLLETVDTDKSSIMESMTLPSQTASLQAQKVNPEAGEIKSLSLEGKRYQGYEKYPLKRGSSLTKAITIEAKDRVNYAKTDQSAVVFSFKIRPIATMAVDKDLLSINQIAPTLVAAACLLYFTALKVTIGDTVVEDIHENWDIYIYMLLFLNRHEKKKQYDEATHKFQKMMMGWYSHDYDPLIADDDSDGKKFSLRSDHIMDRAGVTQDELHEFKSNFKITVVEDATGDYSVLTFVVWLPMFSQLLDNPVFHNDLDLNITLIEGDHPKKLWAHNNCFQWEADGTQNITSWDFDMFLDVENSYLLLETYEPDIEAAVQYQNLINNPGDRRDYDRMMVGFTKKISKGQTLVKFNIIENKQMPQYIMWALKRVVDVNDMSKNYYQFVNGDMTKVHMEAIYEMVQKYDENKHPTHKEQTIIEIQKMNTDSHSFRMLRSIGVQSPQYVANQLIQGEYCKHRGMGTCMPTSHICKKGDFDAIHVYSCTATNVRKPGLVSPTVNGSLSIQITFEPYNQRELELYVWPMYSINAIQRTGGHIALDVPGTLAQY